MQVTTYNLAKQEGKDALWNYVMAEVAKLDEAMILYTELGDRSPEVVNKFNRRQELITKLREDLGA